MSADIGERYQGHRGPLVLYMKDLVKTKVHINMCDACTKYG